jgi:two-component system sensor histidine kinase RegB
MDTPGSDSEVARIQLSWLIKLRWAAVAAQGATILAVDRLLGVDLPLLRLGGPVGLTVASNLAAAAWVRRGRPTGDRAIGGLLVLDVLLLSWLLWLTGGPSNPFSFLYLVHISLATVLLGARWTWTIAGLSSLCSAALFLEWFWPDGAGLEDASPHMRHMRLHLYGMWVAACTAAVFIVYFVSRIRASLERREAELAQARQRAAQAEKLASLATLAAGAAHELSTPLSTIAVVATELQAALERLAPGEEVLEDVQLVRSEVQRCHEILRTLTADVGEGTGEVPVPVAVPQWLADAIEPLRRQATLRLEIDAALQSARVVMPRQATLHVLRGLVKNAVQASLPQSPVVVRAAAVAGQCRIEIEDTGPGMPPEVLARAGEPFFTTKAPGQGMGLGLYLARTVLTRLGATLQLDSKPGRGTTATVALPLAPVPSSRGGEPPGSGGRTER